MKTITAEKCKDNYLVTISETRIIPCETDVFKLIKQEGLKIKNECSDEKGNHKIFAS